VSAQPLMIDITTSWLLNARRSGRVATANVANEAEQDCQLPRRAHNSREGRIIPGPLKESNRPTVRIIGETPEAVFPEP